MAQKQFWAISFSNPVAVDRSTSEILRSAESPHDKQVLDYIGQLPVS
jgi:hypothetical protein